MSATLYTIGHSTRPIEEFLQMLREAGVEVLWDVRRFPGSRKNPQFGRDALPESLRAASIDYHHALALGGRRSTRPDSPNGAWRVAAFRGYADHMASAEFGEAFDALLEAASEKRVAMMCAEALPHRCHRRLISDYATLKGWQVTHLLTPRRSEPHRLHPDARLTADGGVLYPSPDQRQLELAPGAQN